MADDILINEQVKVWTFFDGDIFPIAISWRRRLIKFQKVIFKTTKQVGEVKLVKLICEGTSANFELEYNSNNYLWKLKRVISKD